MSTRRISLLLTAAAMALGSAPTLAQVKWQGGLLTDLKGVPLYVSEAEPAGVSQCYGACVGLWIPYKAPKNAKPTGELSLIRRDDGTLQWAFRGKALYHWFNAEKPMDGQGMRGGNWHVVKQP